MIFLFRKEIKKWNTVWWVVLASLALSGGAMAFFLKNPSTKDSVVVACVDGKKVSLKDFHQVYAGTKSKIDDMARYFGMSADRVAQMFGVQNMEEDSLQSCIQNELLNKVACDFNIDLHPKYFVEQLGKSVSSSVVDQTGRINMTAYQNYLSRLHMTVSDFEKSREAEFKRNLIMEFTVGSGYITNVEARDLFEYKNAKKSFSIAVFTVDQFEKEAKKKTASKEQLKSFFKENKEHYREQEKKKSQYWVLSPEDYSKKIVVDDQMLKTFYERNKASLYRIPPKVQVRTIVVRLPEDASPDSVISAERKINLYAKEIKENPEKFASIAKKYSEDKETATKGGLLDFFKRGTHDPELERVAFLVLKKNGEISNVIKTKRGFEIVKLEDRISASEKPLEDVKDEIEKTLKSRKALTSLKGDLEVIVRKSRSDENAINDFVKENKLKATQTDWLTADQGTGYEIEAVLVQRVFSEDKRSKKYGYFVHQGKHVLYVINDVQKSFIPKFEKAEKEIAKDYYSEQGEKTMEEAIQQARVKVLDGVDFKKVCDEFGVKLVTTKKVKSDESIDEFKDIESLSKKAHGISDVKQVLVYQHEKDAYLIQLVNKEAGSQDEYAKNKELLVKDHEVSKKQLYFEAFIASLRRNAKIEIYKNMVTTYAS